MRESSPVPAGKSMAETPPPDRSEVAVRIADALRIFVGPHQVYSRDLIAAATRIDPRSVKAHCLGEVPPSVTHLFAYFKVLPVEFAEHALALAGLGGVRRLGAVTDAGAALAAMGHGLAALADALADGRIDHVERRTLPKSLRETAAAAEHLAADLERSR